MCYIVGCVNPGTIEIPSQQVVHDITGDVFEVPAASICQAHFDEFEAFEEEMHEAEEQYINSLDDYCADQYLWGV